jgi:hypothetical protein
MVIVLEGEIEGIGKIGEHGKRKGWRPLLMDPSLVEKPWPFSESLCWSSLLNVLSGSFIFRIHALCNVDSLNSESWKSQGNYVTLETTILDEIV